MESYIEVSFLFAFVTIFLSIRSASYWCVKPMRTRLQMAYAAVISLSGCLFFSYDWLLMILLELLFLMRVFRCQRKVYLLGFALRALCFFSVFAWYGGSFHNGIYFLPLHEMLWIVWLCYGIWGGMLRHHWKNLLARGEYVYGTRLILKKKEVALKGYLDSGNLLCHHGIPVIFLDQKYSSYFDENSIELVVMNTIQKSGMIRCYPSRLCIDGCKEHLVYVCCDKTLTLPFDCEVLLNMNAMTLG